MLQNKPNKKIDKRSHSWSRWGLMIMFVLTSIILIISGCTNDNEQKTVSAAKEVSKITQANEHIGFSFLQTVDADENGNIFISPTSALIAMLMVYNGTDGDTRLEIEDALLIDSLDEEEVNEATKRFIESLMRDENKIEVTTANSLWINDQFSFKESFSKNMVDYFNAEIDAIDITDNKSADRINDWVKKETNGLIEEIVDKPLPQNLVAYLINALYFNGTWAYEFNKSLTQTDTFYTESSEKELPFMTLDEELDYFETDELQAVKLPYGEGEMTMQLFLPKEDVSIDELINDVNAETWQKWQRNFSEVEGTVRLPKFKMEYETILNDALKELGIVKAFGEGEADFSNMIDTPTPLFISEVKQKTAIEVDEEGTEAAAVTSVGIEMTSAPIDEVERFYMNINRPFLFAIYDEDYEHILFLGIVKSPEENN